MDALGDFRFLILMIRQFTMEKSLSRDTLMSLSAVNEYYPKIQFLLFWQQSSKRKPPELLYVRDVKKESR